MPLFPIVKNTATAPFLDAAERGELLLVRDSATGEYLEPSVDIAGRDHLEYTAASGRGTIVSWSVNRGKNADGSPRATPFGIVQLDEGPWLWAEITGAQPDEHLTGLPVTVDFVKTGPAEEHATVPVFTVDRSRATGAGTTADSEPRRPQ